MYIYNTFWNFLNLYALSYKKNLGIPTFHLLSKLKKNKKKLFTWINSWKINVCLLFFQDIQIIINKYQLKVSSFPIIRLFKYFAEIKKFYTFFLGLSNRWNRMFHICIWLTGRWGVTCSISSWILYLCK